MKIRSCFLASMSFLAIACVFAPAAVWASPACATANNLVQNCSFSSYTFGDPFYNITDWTAAYAASGSDLGVFGAEGYEGDNVAFFAADYGPTGDYANYDQLSQTLATTAGDKYNLNFWLSDAGAPVLAAYADFIVDWDGVQIDDIQATSSIDNNTEFSFVVTATGPDSTLSFAGWDRPSYYLLSDVSVTPATSPVPEPSSVFLVLTGLAGMGGMMRRKLRA